MKVESVRELLEECLRDLYNAETQLTKALPKMVKMATTPELKEVLSSHMEETEEQISRLEQIGQILEIKLTGKKCKAMAGLLEEGKEVMEIEAIPAIVDLAIIGAAQKVEHYEISGYGTARAFAEQLKLDDAVQLLTETLEEESDADEKLTSVCQEAVLPKIKNASPLEDDDEEEDEDDDELETTASETRAKSRR